MQIVNVGCGQSPTAGALNFDNSPSVALGHHPLLCRALSTLHLLPADNLAYARFCRENRIQRMSCTKMRIPDESVDVLYSSHMLEHLLRVHADQFLQEAYRVLKPDGTLRLVVPDMRRLAEAYIADGDCEKFVISTLLANDHSGSIREHIRFAVTGFRGHRWMYDAASLASLLRLHGFAEIRSLAPGETGIPFATGIDLAERADESIYMECKKHTVSTAGRSGSETAACS